MSDAGNRPKANAPDKPDKPDKKAAQAAQAPPEDVLLRFDNAAVRYGEEEILSELRFDVADGEFVYLIGRTGSGKSSILKLIYADVRPARGEVWVEKFAISKITTRQIPYLRRRLGIVFQAFELLPDRSVQGNLEFVLRATGWRDASKIKARITEVLMTVGLSNKMNSYPHQLSGGEQQRTTLARALLNQPAILIADEPTGNLDPEVTGDIMEILHKINRAGTAVLMATHEHELIERFPGRVLEVIDGGITDRGKVKPQAAGG